MKYKIKVESLQNDILTLRFYSEYELKLLLKQFRCVCESQDKNARLLQHRSLYINNEARFRDVDLNGFNNYSELYFTVVNETDRVTNKVHINLIDRTVYIDNIKVE
ncbi:MAG: hypothetical protein KBT46_08975 [Ruminococcus sp.]|nr:hypothetical protein [Candidatus Copronaster equi]